MIPAEELTEIGRFGKPHGIKGELSAVISDGDINAAELPCIFVELDGLMVPFFIASARSKGSESILLTFEGIDTQDKAAKFANKVFYARQCDMPENETDGEGFYLDDLTGFHICCEGKEIGIISDFDDSTENYLFVVETPDSDDILIPANPELIEEVDTDNQIIHMNLPIGLINL